MSYLDIPNLYKEQDILMFKECYALEKIHGTSAHISFKLKQGYTDLLTIQGGFGILEPVISFFAGGEKHENFIKLFNMVHLSNHFSKMGIPEMTIYGEAYGGKCQGMSATYGKELKFVAFDVKIGDNWLSVPQAEEIVKNFELDFVWYNKIPTELSAIDSVRDTHSIQAIKNGIGEGHKREGIVLRPLVEVKKNNGERIIAKHKNEEFKERANVPKVSPERLEVMTKANEIAEEWVTEMRLTHVLDAFSNPDITKTGEIVKAMVEDVIKEGKDEIIDSKETRSAIGRKTAILFKDRLKNGLNYWRDKQ